MALNDAQLKIVNDANGTIEVLEAKMQDVIARADAAIKTHQDAIASIESQRSTALSNISTRIATEKAKIAALIDAA